MIGTDRRIGNRPWCERTPRWALSAMVLSAVVAAPLQAQQSASDQELQANNPLASFKTFNMHNYYVPKLFGIPDQTSNTFWFRYAQPIGRVLFRASLPIATVPGASATADPESGIGDLNAFATYLAISSPQTSLGIGPIITIPTASNSALGSGKWQGGAAIIAFHVVSPQLQIGGLVTYQASFAGDENRPNTSILATQPFAMFQLGGGTYLRSTGIWLFDLENGTFNMPYGLGIGQVIKSGKMMYNIFAEPQFTVLHDGVGQPAIQFFFGLNIQSVG